MSVHTAGKRQSSGALAFVTTVLLTSFVAATYGFGFYLFSQIVTDMRADLGFDYTVVGVITAGGQFGFLLFALAGTWLAAKFGGPQVCIGSVLLCGLSLVLVPTTNSVVFISALLLIAGGTAASVYVPLVEIVGRVIDFKHRGKVLGLVSSGTSYGVFINSLLVPPFIGADNWRGLWYSVGAATLMVTVVATWVFWRSGLFTREADATGTAAKPTPFSGVHKVLIRWVVIVWLMKFLNGFASMPYQNYLSPYLREDLGFSVGYASTVWGVIGVVGMFAGFVVGWLSDRTGVRFALILSYSCYLVSTVLLVVAPIGQLPVVSGVLFALAFYPIYGLVPAYVSKTAKGVAATVIFGMANVTQGVGGIAGNYLAGTLKNLTGSFMWFYVVIAVGTVVLGVLTTTLPREGGAGPQPRRKTRGSVPPRTIARKPQLTGSAR